VIRTPGKHPGSKFFSAILASPEWLRFNLPVAKTNYPGMMRTAFPTPDEPLTS
jgi:hypothetical protein